MACASQASRRSPDEMVTPANGSAPYTSVCARRISPYSRGNTSSDALNSESGSRSGVPMPLRVQSADRCAHASRSLAVSDDTSAIACSGAVASPSTWPPYTTSERSRPRKIPPRSRMRLSAAGRHVCAIVIILDGWDG